MRAALLVVALLACRPSFELGASSDRGSAPLADAGAGTTVRLNATITLDGSRSVDPDGSLVGYRWLVIDAPANSVASIADTQVAVTTFVPDVVGLFTFELEVTDADGQTDKSRVIYEVIPLELTVNAGGDASVEWRRPVQLAGTVAVEGSEIPVLTWSFVSKPARSAAVLQNGSTLTPSFVADAAGTYVLELAAATSAHQAADTVTVIAAAQRVEFQGAFIDAVFASDIDTDRLIAISDSPPRIRFINPTTGGETTIPLPSTPTALAIDQYENSLAVATSGKVHIVDVFTMSLMGTYNVPFAISKLVFGPFQLVHCFTPQAGPIQTLDLMSGTVTPSANSVPAGTAAKQLLNNYEMYAIEATTPPDLARYRLNVAPVVREVDSPYAGEYAMGQDLWLWSNMIFVAAGNVFQINQYPATDMTYRAHLGGDEPATLEWAYVNYPTKVVTLHSVSGGNQLRLYDFTSLALLESVPLPDIVVNGVPQPSTGRLIAYSPSYPNKFVIVASAGSSNSFIVTYP